MTLYVRLSGIDYFFSREQTCMLDCLSIVCFCRLTGVVLNFYRFSLLWRILSVFSDTVFAGLFLRPCLIYVDSDTYVYCKKCYVMKSVAATLFFALILMLGACSSRYYYQIYEVKGDNVMKMDDCLLFNDGDCSVMYNFWSKGGLVDFIIVNNTDSIMYIDMEKSFFVRNGLSYDYFENTAYVTGSGNYSSSYSLGSLNMNGFSSIFFFNNNVYSGKSNSDVNVAVSSNAGPSKYKFQVKQERPVLLIPPYGAKLISKFVLWSGDPYSDDICERDLIPKDSIFHSYFIQNSPLVFSNFITYSVGESGKPNHINNMFYVSAIINFNGALVNVEEKFLCEGESYPRTVSYMKGESPDRFYVKYYR